MRHTGGRVIKVAILKLIETKMLAVMVNGNERTVLVFFFWLILDLPSGTGTWGTTISVRLHPKFVLNPSLQGFGSTAKLLRGYIRAAAVTKENH